MTQSNFSATVNNWVSATKERVVAVRNESAQRVMEAAQARVPVDTGFARASFQVSLNSPPINADQVNPGGAFQYDPGAYSLVIAGAKINDTIVGSWGANYITFLEYGTSKMAAFRFVGLAVQQWPQIVSEVAAEAQSRASQ